MQRDEWEPIDAQTVKTADGQLVNVEKLIAENAALRAACEQTHARCVRVLGYVESQGMELAPAVQYALTQSRDELFAAIAAASPEAAQGGESDA